MKNDYSKEAFLLKIFKEELKHSQNIIKYSKKAKWKKFANRRSGKKIFGYSRKIK